MDFTDKSLIEILTALMATGNLRLIFITIFVLGAAIAFVLTKRYYEHLVNHQLENKISDLERELNTLHQELEETKQDRDALRERLRKTERTLHADLTASDSDPIPPVPV